MRKSLILLVALAVAATTLTACGSKQERTTAPAIEPLSVMLDYLPNADHAGIYQAQASGEFKREGLDVTLQTPTDPASPLKLLAAGKVDLAISYEPEVLLARDQGQRIVSVGALIQRPLTSLMALPAAHVRSAKDLKGKLVGTAGIPYQSAYLKTIESEAGLPANAVREISVGFNLVPAMLSKKVDATLGAFWNVEGVQLRQARKNPVIIPVDKLGVPTYNELVVVARRDTVDQQGAKIRRFMRALSRATEQVRANPSAGVDALVRANPGLDRRFQAASVAATIPAFFPTDTKQPFGFQDPAAWKRYGQWMFRNGLVKTDPAAENAITNEFLPGEGV